MCVCVRINIIFIRMLMNGNIKYTGAYGHANIETTIFVAQLRTVDLLFALTQDRTPFPTFVLCQQHTHKMHASPRLDTWMIEPLDAALHMDDRAVGSGITHG